MGDFLEMYEGLPPADESEYAKSLGDIERAHDADKKTRSYRAAFTGASRESLKGEGVELVKKTSIFLSNRKKGS